MVWEDGCSSNSKDYCGWRCEEERYRGEYWSGTLEPDLSVKVMTDEQIEILRGQISIYAAICEQLVDMYRDFTARQESLAGMKLGCMYHPSSSAEVPKSFVRHRWTPTATQLQILEGIFKQGNGTPSKQKISGIAAELSKHGQVSDAKVYNWFQNRRARSKKKQVVLRGSCSNLKLDADAEYPNGKKLKLDKVRDLDDLLHPEPGRQLLI